MEALDIPKLIEAVERADAVVAAWFDELAETARLAPEWIERQRAEIRAWGGKLQRNLNGRPDAAVRAALDKVEALLREAETATGDRARAVGEEEIPAAIERAWSAYSTVDPEWVRQDARAAFDWLATLDRVEYEKQRRAVADALTFRVGVVDDEVARRRVNAPEADATATLFKDVDPWPEPVAGAALLDEVKDWLSAHVSMTAAAAVACALWSATTWLVDALEAARGQAPILHLRSPVKRAAKTRLMRRLGRLVRRPLDTSGVGITPAVVFRVNEAARPTLLIDEAERLADVEGGNELIGLLNTGFEAGSRVYRMEKDRKGRFVTRAFRAFGFRLVVSIGPLVDTIEDRAIVIPLQRAKRGEKVRRDPARVWRAEGEMFSRKLARWAADHAGELEAALEAAPRPEGLDDRAADLWAPLFAVAALAGGEWPERALKAAEGLSAGRDGDEFADSVALLGFIRKLFIMRDALDARRARTGVKSDDRMMSATLVEDLNMKAHHDEEVPEPPVRSRSGLRYDAWTPRLLAQALRPFAIRSRKIRVVMVETSEGEEKKATVQGYLREDFESAWARYLQEPVEEVVE